MRRVVSHLGCSFSSYSSTHTYTHNRERYLFLVQSSRKYREITRYKRNDTVVFNIYMYIQYLYRSSRNFSVFCSRLVPYFIICRLLIAFGSRARYVRRWTMDDGRWTIVSFHRSGVFLISLNLRFGVVDSVA